MVRRSTWILLLVLAAVVGAYYLIQSHPFKVNEITTPTPAGNSYLITQTDGALQSLRVFDKKGNNFQMQRDLSKTWVITSPRSGAADQGLAGAAETQVGALLVVSLLEPPPDASEVGLDVPADTLELRFVDGAEHVVEVGNITPTSSGYYIRYDKSRVYVIDRSGIDSLLNLLIAPPFPATETPSLTAESTSTPTAGIASPVP